MLFESPTTRPMTQNASYDVAMNGRFLMVKTAAPNASAPPAQIVLNWVAGMSK
jgi:hypothetical protein